MSVTALRKTARRAGGHFDANGFPVGKGWEEIAFPQINDEHAYALEISGYSMRPAYRNGDVIVVSPAAPVRRRKKDLPGILARCLAAHVASMDELAERHKIRRIA